MMDDDEVELVRRLCSGDEGAFEQLVTRYHTAMVRLARSFVSNDAAAEDAAQEAWLGALRGIERFEGRSTVKTWLFRILVNKAKTHGVREARTAPLSSLEVRTRDSVDPGRFARGDLVGEGASSIPSWRNAPERSAISGETREAIKRALDRLPPAQRAVVALRDVWGLSATEACEMLDLTEANQRVLLHRGRSTMRALLADTVAETAALV